MGTPGMTIHNDKPCYDVALAQQDGVLNLEAEVGEFCPSCHENGSGCPGLRTSQENGPGGRGHQLLGGIP